MTVWIARGLGAGAQRKAPKYIYPEKHNGFLHVDPRFYMDPRMCCYCCNLFRYIPIPYSSGNYLREEAELHYIVGGFHWTVFKDWGPRRHEHP